MNTAYRYILNEYFNYYIMAINLCIDTVTTPFGHVLKQ